MLIMHALKSIGKVSCTVLVAEVNNLVLVTGINSRRFYTIAANNQLYTTITMRTKQVLTVFTLFQYVFATYITATVTVFPSSQLFHSLGKSMFLIIL